MDIDTLKKAKELEREIEELADVEHHLKNGQPLRVKNGMGYYMPLHLPDEDHIKIQKYVLRLARASARSKKAELNKI